MDGLKATDKNVRNVQNMPTKILIDELVDEENKIYLYFNITKYSENNYVAAYQSLNGLSYIEFQGDSIESACQNLYDAVKNHIVVSDDEIYSVILRYLNKSGFTSEEVNGNFDLHNLDHIDSLEFIGLLIELEKHFCIINPKNCWYENVKTVGDLVSVIKDLLKK